MLEKSSVSKDAFVSEDVTFHTPEQGRRRGFAHRNDYVLFGLLVRHDLCKPADFEYLVEAQQTDYADKPLIEILAELNELNDKTRANIHELMDILATPKLRDLLPQELPEVATLRETIQARNTTVHHQATEIEAPENLHQAATEVEAEPGLADTVLTGLSGETRTHLTEEEFERITKSRPKSPLVGRELAGHVIIDRLGAGGQGEVYLAKQLSLNRYVALKRLDVPLGSHEDFIRAFREEAVTLGRINHSRIVKVHEIFEVEDHVFFTMEYLHGKTLKDLVTEADGPLPLDVVANLACQACSAFGRTSEDGLVHRDIKPANMLLDENGDLKIFDFGLAGLAADFSTGTKGFSGTPHFASPEQFRLEPLGPASDQYSLGMTLYYALAGRNAWDSKRMTDLLDEMEKGDPPPPSRYNEDLPRAVDRVIQKMISRDPQKRYRDFDECFEEWSNILAGVQKGRGVGTAQLLGDALLRLTQQQRRRLYQNGTLLCVGWLLVAVGAFLGEGQIRGMDMAWLLDMCGDWGTYILTFSLLCIFYVASARKGYLPVFGSLRFWLYVHIATAVPSVALLMIHSGHFLRGIMPGGQTAKPILSILMALTLLVTAASGTVGLLLFRELRRQIDLQKLELRKGMSSSSREMMLTLLGARLLSGWRLVHYPLAIFFIVLSIMHIALILRMGM